MLVIMFLIRFCFILLAENAKKTNNSLNKDWTIVSHISASFNLAPGSFSLVMKKPCWWKKNILPKEIQRISKPVFNVLIKNVKYVM